MSDECDHEWEYITTYEDWFDGDEEDLYECTKCGKKEWRYAPR